VSCSEAELRASSRWREQNREKIKEHCLDKQKVRDVIDELYTHTPVNKRHTFHKALHKIKEKLGL